MSISGEGLSFIKKFEPENVPEELRAERSWVCWKYVKRDGKATKNLYRTNRRQAASDDASTWTTFEAAVNAARQDEWFDGVGFVFHEGNAFAGADIDNVPRKVSREQAQRWIEHFASYTERSPSGDGYHIICKAELPEGTKRDEGELYSSGRFFTVTGDVVLAEPIGERQATAEEFYRYLRRNDSKPRRSQVPAGDPPATDDVVIEKLLHETSGKGRRLFGGDTSGYASASEAEQAFMNKLYYYTQDEGQIDVIWRRSGMYRDKWEREDYRRRTYMKAANLITETYNWPSAGANYPNPANRPNSANSPNRPNPVVKSAAKLLETKMEPTRWSVPGVLPEGVSLLAGKPKQGKSWLALGLCEAIAAGGVALGTKKVEKGETLYLALEDNERRMQKRLRKVLAGRGCPEGLYYETAWPRLEEGGTGALALWLEETPGARLVVIDTLQKVRTPARGKNVYAEDYAALESLMPLAARYQVSILVVHHLRKGEAADPQDEISGSTGLAGGVDGYMILRRKAGSQGPTLYVDGRDIEEPAEYALHWNLNTATWTIEGTAEEVHISKERGDILVELNRSPEPMSPKELAEVMPGKTHGAVKYLLHQMYHDDQVNRVSGKYEPANRTANRQDPHENAENAASISRVRAVREGSEERPVSWDLEPGESATVGELQERRGGNGHKPGCLCEECLPV